jgi:hypothetical protein
MTKFFTFRATARRLLHPGQTVRFLTHKGYWIYGKAIVRWRPFTMYDSVDLTQIPADAVAVAGYVNGKYQTFPELATRFPHAKRGSIDVLANADADFLDVEKGDATPEHAAAWVKRQLALGRKRPGVYCSVSAVKGLLELLAAAGIPRTRIRLWTAHYTFLPHLCGPACGYGMSTTADATQYTDIALGHKLDASLCTPRFL